MLDVWSCFINYVKNQSDRLVYILIFAIVFFIVIYIVQGNKSCLPAQFLFGISCAIIFVLTLLGREQRSYGVVEMSLDSYLVAFCENDSEKILQIIMNIVMYIPFGLSLVWNLKKVRKWWKVFAIALVTSLYIEVIQGIFSIGLFELEDIINNVLGAMIGAFLYEIISKIHKKITSEHLKEISNE